MSLPKTGKHLLPQLAKLLKEHQEFLQRPNKPTSSSNGIFQRYEQPVVTAMHGPITWRYDLNARTNPLGLERIGINATFNPGAVKWKGKYVLAVRVEGNDRKSFLPWQKVLMELITLNSGINRYLCPNWTSRIPTFTTCGLLSIKMGGSMDLLHGAKRRKYIRYHSRSSQRGNCTNKRPGELGAFT